MTSPKPSRRRLFLLIAGGVAAVAVVVGLVIFKPWLLFVDVEVNDELPISAAPAAPVTPATPSVTAPTDPTATPAPEGESPPSQPPAAAHTEPVRISTGSFVSHEHETTGTASIVRLPDGSHKLILENLATTNGPDVRVWLSKGPVIEGFDGWFTAGEHEFLDIAPIKGNLGNQVYDLPADFDPAEWPTVDLWCEDFAVSFGAAALTPVS